MQTGVFYIFYFVGFRQTKAMGDAEKDYDELNFRVKGANTRARHLLGR
jgi:synaptosomal-associated protein 25